MSTPLQPPASQWPLIEALVADYTVRDAPDDVTAEYAELLLPSPVAAVDIGRVFGAFAELLSFADDSK